MFGLQRGTEVLKEIRKEMGGVEGVEKLMARNEEERRFTEEVADMLSGQMTREEEDEVEDELEAIRREQAVKEGKTLNLPNAPDARVEEVLPNAPGDVPAQAQRRRKGEEEIGLVPA